MEDVNKETELVDTSKEGLKSDNGSGTVELVDTSKEGLTSDNGGGNVELVDTSKEGLTSDNGSGTVASNEIKNTDEYSYIHRDGFTSEIYKIEVHNIPKYARIVQLKKKCNALNLKPRKLKIVQGQGQGHFHYAFMTFSNEEERTSALDIINNCKWKGQMLKAKKANPKADPLHLKRKIEGQGEGEPEQKKGKNDDLFPEEKLLESIIPLAKIPYNEQLKEKEMVMKSVLQKLGNLIKRNATLLSRWILQQRKSYDGMCCPLEPIRPSPVTTGYRNKNEFTIGKDLDGHDVVGFRYGRYRGGSSKVGDPHKCRNVPEKALKFAKVFQEYVRTTKWGAFDPELCKGHWKVLTVRTSHHFDGMMAIVEFISHSLAPDDLKEVKENLTEYFSIGNGKSDELTSLYFQANDSNKMCSPSLTAPYELLFGKKQIYEKMLDLSFQISPSAFFQVNTSAAEVLYKTVADWSEVTPETTLLDVCCGTGTIGLTMARKVKKVIGIEMCQQAVDDAIENAKVNGINNAEYRCGKAEDIMQDLTSRLDGKDVVAVVDPPRSGLQPRVIQSIRRCTKINKLVYISCSPSSALPNFEDLTRPVSKRTKGDPFIPVKAVPVDLFPDTPHCEMVILFERVTDVGKLNTVDKPAASNSGVDSIQQLSSDMTVGDNHLSNNDDKVEDVDSGETT